MEYTWNPWYGCKECSIGCNKCYAMNILRLQGKNPYNIRRATTGFKLPLSKIKDKYKKLEKYEMQYKIPSYSTVRVCTTSDFFIEEADEWRAEAWKCIHERYDIKFIIETHRPERISQCLPDNWASGWDNVIIYVSAEDTETAWRNIPIVLNLDIKHIGISVKPMLEHIDLSPFLCSGLIESVEVCGESYTGYNGLAKELNMNDVIDVAKQCKEYLVNFNFLRTGSRLKTTTGKIVYIRRNDEVGMADFMKLDDNTNIEDWKYNVEKVEQELLDQSASYIYKKLQDNKFQ